jgi:radical SAM superfamily enzyme YgiQ (UPF0313 family)
LTGGALTLPKPAVILLAVINAKWIHPSLALRLLKANLGEYEARAAILEFALRQPLSEKIRPILEAAPRILGVSVSIWNHTATLELLKALYEGWGQGKRPVVVLGGPEVSCLSPDAELFGYADFVIRGEGEAVFRELCGLILKRGGDPRDAGALPSVQSAEGKCIRARKPDPVYLASAYRLYTPEDLAGKLTYVEASRGCPFGCEFCLSSLDREVREFPLDDFLAEMEGLIERGGRTFKFLDRSFNINPERAGTIMEFFLNKLKRRGFTVHFEMIPWRFPRELRKIITRFPPGSLRLELGIQTFNPQTAALIGRSGDPEQELEILHFLRRETNAIVHADLIAGLPGEDLPSFGRGFDRLWLAGPAEIQPGILKRLPGTAIARHDKTWGMIYAPDPPYEVRETSVLPRGDLERIKNFARFWELIVNRTRQDRTGTFAVLAERLFPGGEPVFDRFMALSDRLHARFGRNWGIDRKELWKALADPQISARG